MSAELIPAWPKWHRRSHFGGAESWTTQLGEQTFEIIVFHGQTAVAYAVLRWLPAGSDLPRTKPSVDYAYATQDIATTTANWRAHLPTVLALLKL